MYVPVIKMREMRFKTVYFMDMTHQHHHHRRYIKPIMNAVLIVCLLCQVISMWNTNRASMRIPATTQDHDQEISPPSMRSMATTTSGSNHAKSHNVVSPQYPHHRARRKSTPHRSKPNPVSRSHINTTDTVQGPIILMIHIGKTGGETTKHILSIGCQSMMNRRRKQSCRHWLPRNRNGQYSQLSKHTYGYYHCDKMIVAPHIQQQLRSSPTTFTLPDMVAQFDSYLFTIRHPVDRIWSWYNYVHPQYCTKYHALLQNYFHHYQQQSDLAQQQPRDGVMATTNTIGTENMVTINNVTDASSSSSSSAGISCQTVQDMIRSPTGFAATFFFKCFPTIQDWSDALLLTLPTKHNAHQTNGRNIDEECIRLANQSIRGELPNDRNDDTKGRVATHLMANYRHYMNHTVYADTHTNVKTKKKTIYVVRTEHLWEDLRSVDVQQLQGDGDFGNHTGTAITHGVPKRTPHPHHDVHNPVPRMMTIFCCALMEEMEHYMYLIYHARNLIWSEKQRTIQATIQYCLTGASSTAAKTTTTRTIVGANETNFDRIISMTTWKDILQDECDRIR
jgi:hypothetical protein